MSTLQPLTFLPLILLLPYFRSLRKFDSHKAVDLGELLDSPLPGARVCHCGLKGLQAALSKFFLYFFPSHRQASSRRRQRPPDWSLLPRGPLSCRLPKQLEVPPSFFLLSFVLLCLFSSSPSDLKLSVLTQKITLGSLFLLPRLLPKCWDYRPGPPYQS